MAGSPAIPGSRERLLAAATEVFTEQGFRDARVRDICERAGANGAAVNYYFRDKKGLYHEVLQRSFFSLAGDDPTDWGVGEEAPAPERLHAFVRTILTSLLAEGPGARHAKLVAREMVEPTDAVTTVIEDGIRPQFNILFGLVRQRLGREADDQLVRRCASSIVGQCLFYYFAGPAISQLLLEDRLYPLDLESIADHITTFSLASLEQLARRTPSRTFRSRVER